MLSILNLQDNLGDHVLIITGPAGVGKSVCLPFSYFKQVS